MATKTARAAEPAPASSAEFSAELESQRREIAARRKKREAELNAPRDLTKMDQGQISQLEADLGVLKLLIKQDEQLEAKLTLRFKLAKNREDHAAALKDADELPRVVPDTLRRLNAEERVVSDTRSELGRYVRRSFEVKSLLTSDPFAGILPQLCRALPTDGHLADLAREGRSFLQAAQQWPKLVYEAGTGGAHYEDLELIDSHSKWVAWRTQEHQPIPGGSRASQQLGELASRFGR